MEEHKLDIRRLKDMSESLKMLLEYYEKGEIIDVYIYYLIAMVLNTYLTKTKQQKTNQNLDNKILSLVNMADENDEIKMKKEDLSKVVDEINNEKISKTIVKILLIKYNLKEQEIDIKYKLNSHVTDEKELPKLNKDYKKILLNQLKIAAYIRYICQKNFKQSYIDNVAEKVSVEFINQIVEKKEKGSNSNPILSEESPKKLKH